MNSYFQYRIRPSIAMAALAVGTLLFTAAALARDNPFAAHNAYPWRLYPKDRFDKALDSGLKHIEVDVSYDPQRQAVVATHDAQPNGKEPELGQLLTPLWDRWGKATDDGYTLIIDFKISSPEIVRGVQGILVAHRELLSTMPKAGGDFWPGKITVCLTGATSAHRLYADSIPDDGGYLAFSDGTGCPGDWQNDVSAYVPKQTVGFVRFITLEKQNFMDAAKSRGNEHVSKQRLTDVVKLANAGGYRIRVYTINPARTGDAWDTVYWDACVAAGVHMIATDAYDLARDYWGRRATNR